MVQDQGIDVYVAPYDRLDERYKQYALPTSSPKFNGDSNEVYIEAVDGERFVIVTDLLKDFDKMGCTHLDIESGVDRNCDENGCSGTYTFSSMKKSVPRSSGLKGRSVLNSMERKVHGDWVLCGFTFGALKIDENLHMDHDRIEKDIEFNGRLRVKITRGYHKHIKTQDCKSPSTPFEIWQGIRPSDTLTSSKLVIEDNLISHAVKHVVLESAAQPLLSTSADWQWRDADGEAGVPICFTIRYRSRKVLQKLQLIPKHISYIDLTDSCESLPTIKDEESANNDQGVILNNIKSEPRIKREPMESRTIQSGQDAQTGEATQVLTTALSDPRNVNESQSSKKRKEMKDEIREIELEQKKLRLMKQLAGMKNT